MSEIKYPWFRMRNLYNGKIETDLDPKDEFPAGWWKSFGSMMLAELDEAIREANIVDEFCIGQIKEKFGQLRFYYHPYDEKVDIIVHKYEALSENICIVCGKPDVPMLNMSWISPFCKDCYDKIIERKTESIEKSRKAKDDNTPYQTPSYKELAENESKMQDSYTVRKYTPEKDGRPAITTEITYDISATAERIRQNWKNNN